MRSAGRTMTAKAVAAALAACLAAVMAAPAAAADAETIVTLQEKIEKVAEGVGKSVVSVTTMGRAPEAMWEFDLPWEMLPKEWRKYLPDTPRRRRERSDELVPRGLGSGVVISAEGHILTNQHVIQGSEQIEVTLADRRKFKATVVGQDLRSDLAVLKVDAKDLPVAKLDGGVEVRRGLFVVAIGSPFGFGADGQASVSFGIVSGTKRSLPMPSDEERYYGKLIQTDAAINPGNSGGPLCTLEGKVIGINVAIASRTGGSQGVGFAIPIDEATLDIISRLKKGEEVEYGFLGVMIRDPSELESKTAGAEAGLGAFVNGVEPGGPAEKAGIMPADLIVAVDGRPIRSADDLVTTIGRTEVGREVTLTLYRSGKKMEVKAKLVRRSVGRVASAGPEKEKPAPSDAFEWRGLVLRDLTAALRSEAGLGEDAEGVYVDRVDEASGAYERGLRSGMVINQVASEKVKDLEAMKKAVKKLKGPAFVNVVGRGPEVVPEFEKGG